MPTGQPPGARVRERGGRFELLKGLDPAKDQSYFLHRLNQAQLSKTLFPVGELRKAEVRLQDVLGREPLGVLVHLHAGVDRLDRDLGGVDLGLADAVDRVQDLAGAADRERRLRGNTRSPQSPAGMQPAVLG